MITDLVKDEVAEEKRAKLIRFTVTYYPDKNVRDRIHVEKIEKIIAGLNKQLADKGDKRKISEADVIRELLDEALSQYED